MKEIMFKARRSDTMEWECGHYCEVQGVHYIIPWFASALDGHEVIRRTVCQYTGLTDRHNRKIFEGDLVRYNNGIDATDTGIIKYVDGCFVASMSNLHLHELEFDWLNCVEVVGNLWDDRVAD